MKYFIIFLIMTTTVFGKIVNHVDEFKPEENYIRVKVKNFSITKYDIDETKFSFFAYAPIKHCQEEGWNMVVMFRDKTTIRIYNDKFNCNGSGGNFQIEEKYDKYNYEWLFSKEVKAIKNYGTKYNNVIKFNKKQGKLFKKQLNKAFKKQIQLYYKEIKDKEKNKGKLSECKERLILVEGEVLDYQDTLDDIMKYRKDISNCICSNINLNEYDEKKRIVISGKMKRYVSSIFFRKFRISTTGKSNPALKRCFRNLIRSKFEKTYKKETYTFKIIKKEVLKYQSKIIN